MTLFFLLKATWKISDFFGSNAFRFWLHGTRLLKWILTHSNSHRFWIVAQIVLMLCWTPIWLAAWPGFYCYDTATLQSYNDGVYITEHPLLYTAIASKIVFGIGSLLGNTNAGIVCLVAFSSLTTSTILMFSLRYITQNGFPGCALFGFCYFSLNPLIGMFCLCTAKDVFSSALLVLLFLLFLRTMRMPALFERRSIRLSFIALLFILLSLRNNTFIALLIAMPFIIFAYKGKGERKALCTCLATGCMLFAIWAGPISAAITSSYEKTPNFSFLLINSVPEQQLAYVWNNCELTDDERQAYQLVISPGAENALKNIRYDDVDVARGAFAETLIYNRNLPAFYNLYLNEGLKHPRAYIQAALALTYEAWYPLSTPRGYNGGWNTTYKYNETTTSLFACTVEEPATHSSILPGFYSRLWEISRYDTLQANPFFAWLISIPFHLWLLLIAFSRALIKRQPDIYVPCTLLLSTVATFLMGPMVLPRYYLSLFFMAPLLIYCIISATGNAQNKNLKT